MAHLTSKQKETVRKKLAMYLGSPPYDVEEARRLIASGLLEKQSMKYGCSPVKLIREISDIVLTESQRGEALQELTEWFGKPTQFKRRRSSSRMLERRILAKYLMPLKELVSKVGFQTISSRRSRIGTYKT